MFGVKFGNTHTWADLGLRCLSCGLSPPENDALYITVPGMDGSYDATEAIYGRPIYKRRAFEAVFDAQNKILAEHETQYSVINKLFHGKKLQIIADSDPSHYLVGRVNIKPDRTTIYSKYTFSSSCDPYRYKIAMTSQTFNVSGSLEITLSNAQMPVCPTFFTSNKDMSVEYKGIRYSLLTGGAEIDGILLNEGNNSLKLYGNGTVIVEYREGEL